MKPTILFALCVLSACGVSTTDDPELGITQDELRQPCSSFTSELTCHRHPRRCVWFSVPMGMPCQLLADGGTLCPPSSGSCQDRVPPTVDGGSSGGGSSDGGVGVACACPSGGVCVRQLGGPAVQYPPRPISAWRPRRASRRTSAPACRAPWAAARRIRRSATAASATTASADRARQGSGGGGGSQLQLESARHRSMSKVSPPEAP